MGKNNQDIFGDHLLAAYLLSTSLPAVRQLTYVVSLIKGAIIVRKCNYYYETKHPISYQVTT